MSIGFRFNENILSSTDKISISIADLRDIISADHLSNKDDRLIEINYILALVCRKNKLEKNTFYAKDMDLPDWFFE